MGQLEQTMRRHIAEYLAGRESFADFTSWMYRAIWNIDQQGDTGATDLGFAVMLALAEFDSGLLTLADFQGELRALTLSELAQASATGPAAAAS